jgi:hypothetical protein
MRSQLPANRASETGDKLSALEGSAWPVCPQAVSALEPTNST